MKKRVANEKYIKNREVASNELKDMMKYLGVSDRKQIGNRIIMRSLDAKWDLHEVIVGIVNKLKEIEKNAKRKKTRRTETVDGTHRPGEEGQKKLEGKVPGRLSP